MSDSVCDSAVGVRAGGLDGGASGGAGRFGGGRGRLICSANGSGGLCGFLRGDVTRRHYDRCRFPNCAFRSPGAGVGRENGAFLCRGGGPGGGGVFPARRGVDPVRNGGGFLSVGDAPFCRGVGPGNGGVAPISPMDAAGRRGGGPIWRRSITPARGAAPPFRGGTLLDGAGAAPFGGGASLRRAGGTPRGGGARLEMAALVVPCAGTVVRRPAAAPFSPTLPLPLKPEAPR